MDAQVAWPISDPALDLWPFPILIEEREQPTGRYAVCRAVERNRAYPGEWRVPPLEHLNASDVFTCALAIKGGAPGAGTAAGELSRPATYKTCRSMLNDVIPFVWTGKRFAANSRRRGLAASQHLVSAMRGAPFVLDRKIVPANATLRDRRTGRWYKLGAVASPVADPGGGE